MASLAEIRARLSAQDEKKSGNNNSNNNFDKSLYPQWNIKPGESARMRFVPDGDNGNDFFWAEKQVIKLAFPGIKGKADSKNVTISVPCMEMYGEVCPVLAEVRPWYKEDSLKEQANKYWKKRSYILSGFVRDNPIKDDVTPENPLRKFIITPQIFALIRAALLDPEVEEMPTDFQRGLDFTVSKTSKGEYADYSTSKWSRKESALTADELEAIERFGLFNLKSFLPKKPTDVELKVIMEMFEASVDGQLYDLDRWGNYFKPYGVDNDSASSSGSTSTSTVSTSRPTPTQQEKVEEKNETVAETAHTSTTSGSTSSSKAQQILEQIKNRKPKA